jgi:hypothetical protein
VDPNQKELKGFGRIRIRIIKKFGFGNGLGSKYRYCCKIKIIQKNQRTLEKAQNVAMFYL